MLTQSDYLGQSHLLFGLRPIRLGYLVREGSHDQLLAAIEEATSRWGGITEFIFSYDENGRIADFPPREIHPVDHYVLITEVAADVLNTLRDQLGKQPVPLEAFQHGTDGLHQLAVAPRRESPLLQTAALEAADGITHAAATGYVASVEWRGQWEGQGVFLRSEKSGIALAKAQIERRTAIDSTAFQLDELPGSTAVVSPIVVYISGGNSFFDAVAFWNMRALAPAPSSRSPMVLTTADALKSAEIAAMITQAVQRAVPRVEPDILVLGSLDTVPELEGLAKEHQWNIDTGEGMRLIWKLPDTSPRQVGVRIRSGRFIFDWKRRHVGGYKQVVVHVERAGTLVDSDSPIDFTRPIGGQVQARFWGDPYLSLPPGQGFGNLFHDGAVVVDGGIEIRTGPDPHYSFRLRIPTPGALLERSLAEAGVRFKPSDKGLLAAGVLGRIGDPDVLREPNVIAVIRALTTQRVQYDAKALHKEFAGLSQSDAEALAGRLLSIRQDFRTLRDVASRVGGIDIGDVAIAVERLVDSQVAVRGFCIRCASCGLSSFIELPPTSGLPICPGCLSRAEFAKHPQRKESELYYRLNSLVDRASDNGLLGHLLVVAALRRHNSRAYTLPGVLIENEAGSAETDCLALIDGDIWTAEAKPKSEYFTPVQIQHDIDIAKSVRAKNHVIACLDQLPDDVVIAASEACASVAIRLWSLETPVGELQERNVRRRG